MPRWQSIVSVATGIVFLVTLLVIAFFVKTPTEFQEFVFRTVLAIAAGAFATVMSGFLQLEGKWKQFSLRAGAGLAVFIFVYAVNPPKLIQKYAIRDGFVPPTTSRSGDKSVAMTATPDGGVLSLLPDRLVVDLQGERADLTQTVAMTTTLQIVKGRESTAESIENEIRGALYLTPGAAATLSITVGERHRQYEYPFGEKSDLRGPDGKYSMTNFEKRVTTPVSWPSPGTSSVLYPITLSIYAQRKSKADIAYFALDSLDALVRFEGGSR